MNKLQDLLKPYLPHLLAVLGFIAISVIYFNPVMEGKVLPQMDNIHAVGSANELVQFEKSTGERSQWTNSMFSGMPAYQIKGDASANIFNKISHIIDLGLPYTTIAIVFLYLLGFYLLLLSLKVDQKLSAIGAIAFALGSYNIIIIMAGHLTKAYAIAAMAPVIAGILFTYNRNMWVGALITTIGLGLEIAYNHLQITYYLALMVGVIVISKFIYAYFEKELVRFAKASALLVAAAIIALLPSISTLWTTAEYGSYSIRGASELSQPKSETKSSGLDKDYAFAWSYGVSESFTLLVPNLMGGASQALKETPSALTNLDSQYKETVAGQSAYWGAKPFTSGPVYVGALICFLFVLALFYYKGKEKWWLLAATILSLFLSWGQNFAFFNDFMFYHFPLYNKFRTVEMALIIATFTMPLLAFLGLKTIFDNPKILIEKQRDFFIAFGLTGGVALVLFLVPQTFFSFITDQEVVAIGNEKLRNAQMASAYDTLMEQMAIARASLLKADALRSFIFIALGAASLWFWGKGKLALQYLLGALAIIILIDMWFVDRRYLNNEKFENKSANQDFVESKADRFILNNNDSDYRVLALGNPFNEVRTSYFHKSVGGYHGAKLRRYQDVIDRYLGAEHQSLIMALQNRELAEDSLMKVFASKPILNMLNAKYIIYNPDAEPIINSGVQGNGWFVQNVKVAKSADEEIAFLGSANLTQTAIVQATVPSEVKEFKAPSVSGNIKLSTYKPNHLTYEVYSPQNQVAVFSEIYYPKGWNAYIDGKLTNHFCANYILRGMYVPAGKHVVEFKFEPSSFQTGKMLSYFGSLLVLLAIGYFIFWRHKTGLKE